MVENKIGTQWKEVELHPQLKRVEEQNDETTFVVESDDNQQKHHPTPQQVQR